jgi:flagellar biosynthetic protein FlhB
MAENEGSEKTERATPKRLEEARKKGQVPRSADLSAAIVSLIGAGFLYLFGAGAANEMLSVMRDGLSVTSVDLMQSDVLLRHTADQFVHGFLAVVPLMGVLVLAAVAAPALIGGWNFSSASTRWRVSVECSRSGAWSNSSRPLANSFLSAASVASSCGRSPRR